VVVLATNGSRPKASPSTSHLSKKIQIALCFPSEYQTKYKPNRQFELLRTLLFARNLNQTADTIFLSNPEVLITLIKEKKNISTNIY